MVTVHVSANLYSGRENPAWDLQTSQVAYFVSHLERLPVSKPRHVEREGGLGYSGLTVTVHSGAIVQQYVISAGVVSPADAGKKSGRDLEDHDRELESWLVKTGEKILGPDMVAYVLGLLGKPSPTR